MGGVGVRGWGEEGGGILFPAKHKLKRSERSGGGNATDHGKILH